MTTNIIAARDSDELPFPEGGDTNTLQTINATWSNSNTFDIALDKTADLTKSALKLIAGNATNPSGGSDRFTVEFFDADTVRISVSGVNTFTFNATIEVVSFPKAISVSFYAFSNVTGGNLFSDNVISAVNSSSNRIQIYPSNTWNSATSANSTGQRLTAEATSDTNIRLTRGNSTNQCTPNVFVVELPPL